MTWVGLDLSLTSTGMAVVDDAGAVTVRRIRSAGKKTDRLPENVDRLRALAFKVVQAVREVDPTAVVVESALFSTHHDSSAHRRAGLWWLVVVSLYSDGYPIVEVAPSQVKKFATGKGNAPKTRMVTRASAVWGEETFADGNDDVADAAFLAAMAAYNEGVRPVSEAAYRDAIVKAVFDKVAEAETH